MKKYMNQYYVEKLNHLDAQKAYVELFLADKKVQEDKYQELRFKKFLARSMGLNHLVCVNQILNDYSVSEKSKKKLEDTFPDETLRVNDNQGLQLEELYFSRMVQKLPLKTILELWKADYAKKRMYLETLKSQNPSILLDEYQREEEVIGKYFTEMGRLCDSKISDFKFKKKEKMLSTQLNKYLLTRLEFNRRDNIEMFITNDYSDSFLQDSMTSFLNQATKRRHQEKEVLDDEELTVLASLVDAEELYEYWKKTYQERGSEVQAITILATQYMNDTKNSMTGKNDMRR